MQCRGQSLTCSRPWKAPRDRRILDPRIPPPPSNTHTHTHDWLQAGVPVPLLGDLQVRSPSLVPLRQELPLLTLNWGGLCLPQLECYPGRSGAVSLGFRVNTPAAEERKAPRFGWEALSEARLCLRRISVEDCRVLSPSLMTRDTGTLLPSRVCTGVVAAHPEVLVLQQQREDGGTAEAGLAEGSSTSSCAFLFPPFSN